MVSECSKKRLSQGQKQLTLLNSATPSLTKYPLIFLYSHPPRVDFWGEASKYNSISLFSPLLSLSYLMPARQHVKVQVYAHGSTYTVYIIDWTMLLWRYEQSRKERLAGCVYVSVPLGVRVCVYVSVCVCVCLCMREHQSVRVDEKEERDGGSKGW